MRRRLLFTLAPAMIFLALVRPSMGQAPVKRFITKDGQRPDGLFAPGVMVGKTLYIAGKGDYRSDAPFAEKVENCLNEIRTTLRLAGLDMEHVVKSFVYLEDSDKYAELNEHYAKFFPNDPPARTTLGVSLVPGDSRVEITCIAYSDLSEKKRIGDPPANRPYSPGILAGDTLYVSGKGDQLPDGAHPETFEEQVRQAMRNVDATLKQAGLSFENVVMSNVFLDDSRNLKTVNAVYNEFFEDQNEPACATVLVDWIPGGSHVEITCIATTDLSTRKIVRPDSMPYGTAPGSVTASPAVWAGDTLHLSGLPGFKPADGGVVEGLDAQVHQMASNHSEILKAAGLEPDDIVSGFVYLANMEDYQGMNAIYREYYSRGPGVRTCLMPTSGVGQSPIRVFGSFTAARTQ